jgi:Protein of unknown function DUF45
LRAENPKYPDLIPAQELMIQGVFKALKIEADVKVDLLLKVSGRWYNLGFTGDPTDYYTKDVNIANLGRMAGILADGKWHTATIDLAQFLRSKTRHTKVDEIVLANWQVSAFMALNFGHPAADLRPAIERHLWRLAAKELLPRVLEYAALHQLPVRRITVRNQRSRWGSASRRGTISLNWRLIQTPAFVRDYLVLHELMHLRHMNHSARF